MPGGVVKTVTMKVLADAGDTQARLDAIAAKGDEIGKLDVRIRVRVDDPDAKAKLDADKAAVDRLGAKDARIHVTLDDRGVKEKLAEDKAAAAAAGSGMSVAAAGPVLMWGTLGGVIAGLAPVTAAAGLGMAAFGAVAYSNLKTAGTAAQAVHTAQDQYTSSIARANSMYQQQMAVATTAAQVKSATSARNKADMTAEAAQVGAVTKAYAQLSPPQIALSQAIGTAMNAWQSFVQSNTAGVSKILSQGLGLLPRLFSTMQPFMQPVESALSGIISTIDRATAPVTKLGDGLHHIQRDIQVTGPSSSGFASFMQTMVSMAGPSITAIFKVASALTGVLGHALTALAPMSLPFTNMITGLITALGGPLISLMQTLAGVTMQLGQAIIPLLGPVGNLISALGHGLLAVITPLLGPVAQLAGALANGLGQVITKITPGLGQIAAAVGKVITALTPIVSTLITALAPVAGVVASAAGQIASAFAAAIVKAGPALTQLAAAIGQVVTALTPLIPAIVQAAVAFMPLIPAAAKVVAAIAQVVAGCAPAIGKLAVLAASVISTATSFMQFQAKVIGAVVTTVGTVISTIAPLPGKIISIFAAAGTWLFDAGKQVVMGLVHGIESMVGAAVSAAAGVGDSILHGIKAALSIFSPSKKAHVIGQRTIQGLLLGLQGGQTEITTVSTILADSIVKPFTSATITTTIDKLGSMLPARLTGWLKFDNAKLQALANERAILEKEIALSEQVAQQAIQSASIMNAVGASQAGPVAPADTSQILAGMQAQAEQQKAFAQQIAQLRKQGLNATSISQIVQAGAASGLPVAQGITAGGKSAITQINAYESQIHASAARLGDVAGPAMYQAGVDAGKGLAAGLKSQLATVSAAIAQLAAEIIARLKKDLKIKSPSEVTRAYGQFTGQGFEHGILDWLPAVSTAGGRMAAAVTGGLTGAYGGSRAGGGDTYHFHIDGVVTDPNGVARQVVQVLKEYKRHGGGSALGIA